MITRETITLQFDDEEYVKPPITIVVYDESEDAWLGAIEGEAPSLGIFPKRLWKEVIL